MPLCEGRGGLLKNFTDPAVTLFQQPRSKLTEPLEHCSGAAGALLQSCWRNVPSMVWKRGMAKTLIAKRLQRASYGDYFGENLGGWSAKNMLYAVRNGSFVYLCR